MSNKRKYTIESILVKLNRDDKALERALVAIYNNLTEIQLARYDASLSGYAWQVKYNHALRDYELAYARMKLAQVKYAGILRRCADQIMEG